MTSHLSTPRTILTAPVSQPVWVSEQRGWSRQERRHGHRGPLPTALGSAVVNAYLRAIHDAGRNEPYVAPRVERTGHKRRRKGAAS